MTFNNTLLKLLLYIVAIIGTTIAFSYVARQSYMLVSSLGLGLLLITESVALIRFIFRKDRYFENFIDAITNNDATLLSTIKDKPLNEKLHTGYQRVLKSLHTLNEQKTAQEVLNTQIMEQIKVGIVAFYTDGNIKQTNSYFCNLFDLSPLNKPSHINYLDIKLAEALKTLKPGHVKTLKLQTNGLIRHLSLNGSLIKPANNQPYMLASMHDISKEMAQNEQQAWHKMIGILRHEVTNSISPVRLLSGNLLQHAKQTRSNITDNILDTFVNRSIKALEAIHNRSAGLINFVERYKAFSDLTKIQKHRIALASVINDSVAIMSDSLTQGNINIKTITRANAAKIVADKYLLSQVCINLLKNAMEALSHSDCKKIEIIQEQTDQFQQVSISDTGCGIPETLQEEIFTPFFSTKETGSGIGLSLSRQIMLAHDGNLQITSTEDKGTTVVLTFPLQYQ